MSAIKPDQLETFTTDLESNNYLRYYFEIFVGENVNIENITKDIAKTALDKIKTHRSFYIKEDGTKTNFGLLDESETEALDTLEKLLSEIIRPNMKNIDVSSALKANTPLEKVLNIRDRLVIFTGGNTVRGSIKSITQDTILLCGDYGKIDLIKRSQITAISVMRELEA